MVVKNNGSFFGYPKYEVPYYDRDPKRDHNFENHPHGGLKCFGDGTSTAKSAKCTGHSSPKPAGEMLLIKALNVKS